MLRRLSLICLFLATIGGACFAQSSNQSIRPGISMYSSLSFSGLNLGLTVDVSRGPFSLYLGPKLSLNRSYQLFRGPWGMLAGGQYTFNPADKLRHSIHLDYQLSRFSHSDFPSDFVHEAFLSYGLSYRISDDFYIGNTLGYGFYSESVWQSQDNKRRQFSGYNGLIRLLVGYDFN